MKMKLIINNDDLVYETQTSPTTTAVMGGLAFLCGKILADLTVENSQLMETINEEYDKGYPF